MEKMKLDCTELGMIMKISKSTQDTQGRSLEMEWELLPYSGGTPVHIHPEAIETYEVLSGELEVYKDGQWFTAKAGEKVVIDKGVAHTFKNSTNEVVRVYNTHQPALKFEEFFKGLCKFSQSGLVKNGKMNFNAIVGISSLWNNYSKELRSIKPPHMLMKILSFYGKLKGINFK